MPKAMHYVEEGGKKYKIDNNGERYRISWSEELQMKNLRTARRQVTWQRRNFYAKIAMVCVLFIFLIIMLFLLYRLDTVNFFSTLMYN